MLALEHTLAVGASVKEQSEIHFRLVAGFAVIVPVYINGGGPYDFLLDTGATLTVVDSSLAPALDLIKTGDGVVSGPVQPLPVTVTVARSLEVGPIKRFRLEMIVRDLEGVRAIDRSIQGILGQNALNTIDFLIDYHRKRVVIDNDGTLLSAVQGKRLPIVRIPLPGSEAYANSAVCAAINTHEPCATLLALDTGSASLVLFSSEPLHPSAGQTWLRDAAGTELHADLKTVHLCLQSTCWDKNALVVKVRKENSSVLGLLPTTLFERLYVSNQFAFIVPNPRLSNGRSWTADAD